MAYARWAGKQLPTEAQWERAARIGQEGRRYVWGDRLTPGGIHQANIWQGVFPTRNTLEDGHAGTAPVRSYPPNSAGLHELSGNVWEWTADQFRADTYSVRVEELNGAVCENPTGPTRTVDPACPMRQSPAFTRGGPFSAIQTIVRVTGRAPRCHQRLIPV